MLTTGPAAAVDAVFAAMGADVTLTPPSGPARTVRALVTTPVVGERIQGLSLAWDSRRVELRAADAAGVTAGWSATIGGVAYVLRETPRARDPLALTVILDLLRAA